MRVRSIVVLLFVVLLVPMFITKNVDASPAPSFFVNPYRVTTLPGGSTFTITIEISDLAGPPGPGGGENLYGWGATLYWNTVNLDFVSATQGPFLQEGGYDTFWVTPVVYEADGRVDLGCARTGSSVPGVVGGGVLATVTFAVVVEAVTDLHLDLVKLRNDLAQALEPNTGAPDYYFTNLRDGRYGPRAAWDIYVPEWNYEAVIDIFDLSTVGINYGLTGPNVADVWGPGGVPDGVVDVYDLAKVASEYGYYF